MLHAKNLGVASGQWEWWKHIAGIFLIIIRKEDFFYKELSTWKISGQACVMRHTQQPVDAWKGELVGLMNTISSTTGTNIWTYFHNSKLSLPITLKFTLVLLLIARLYFHTNNNALHYANENKNRKNLRFIYAETEMLITEDTEI